MGGRVTNKLCNDSTCQRAHGVRSCMRLRNERLATSNLYIKRELDNTYKPQAPTLAHHNQDRFKLKDDGRRSCQVDYATRANSQTRSPYSITHLIPCNSAYRYRQSPTTRTTKCGHAWPPPALGVDEWQQLRSWYTNVNFPCSQPASTEDCVP